MIDRAQLRSLVASHEGLRLFPYQDTVGKLTIGWGHNLTDVGITREEALTLLDHDLDRAMAFCVRFPFWAFLDGVRQAVLVDLVFTLSSRIFAFQKMLSALSAHDYEQAAVEVLDSQYARQVGQRAVQLADMLRSGQWPVELSSSSPSV